jgi:hypothetical protein
MKEPELAQQDRVLGKWFMEIHSKWKPHDWAFGNGTSCVLNDAVKTPDKCTFSEGWLWEPAAKGHKQME